MFSTREYKASWKAPIVMSAFGLLVTILFGFLGKHSDVVFQLSEKKDSVQLDPISLPSVAMNIVLGFVMLALAAVSILFTLRNKRTPVWLILVFGFLGFVSLLGSLSAGEKDIPVSFILGRAVILAVPIILGAMGGVMSERVGVVNIGIEGQLLTGAFMASVVGTITHSLWFGLIAAVIASALLSMALASLAIKYLVDQIIIGVLINALVIGVTNFLFSEWLAGDAANVNFPGIFDIIKLPLLGDIPVIGPALFQVRITVLLTYLIVPLVWFLLFRTKLGLRARAVGEHPLAADTVGINVGRTRFWWVTVGGAIAGLGGAALTIGDVGPFGQEMTGGLGFIALAVVILGRWQPFYVAASALLFGFAIILRVWAPHAGIPTDFIVTIPYLVTLVAVAGFAGKVRAPAASGQPYKKG
jgi:simple sugar transport system permease protein